MYLASLGADVVKVESPRRPDGFRFVAAYPQLGDRWWEQSGVYHATNLGKRAIAVDLDRPEGLALVKRLIAEADVVVENYSPRVVENFGLGYDAVRALNPAVIMMRMPGFGLSGACRDWVGWALTFEQLAGCAFVTGARDGRMFAPGGFADPVVGMHAAVALQAALAERERAGEGQLVEIAQIEVIASLTAEQVVRYSIAGELMTRNGTARRRPHRRASIAAPAPTSGSRSADGTDDEWKKLRHVLGDPRWADDAQLDSLEGRIAQHDVLDARLSEWASVRDAHAAAEQLLDAGVPAADAAENRGDLRRAAAFGARVLSNRRASGHRATSLPGLADALFFSVSSGSPLRRGRSTLGQHNEEILGGVLGLSHDDVEQLRPARVIGETLE
jgi:crotonobetainyl-CoA:carnitine CoA-transferase CaiB-like acyl-CoA transferase